MPTRLLSIAFALTVAATQAAGTTTRPLWNGKDVTGWTQVGPGRFVLENGLLKSGGGMGLLYWSGGQLPAPAEVGSEGSALERNLFSALRQNV